MVIFLNLLIFIVAYLLDLAKVFSFISVFGIMPQVVFVCLVCFCIFYGKERGLVLAVGIGLITDFITASPVGSHALVFLAVSVVCGITYETVFEKNYFSAALTVFVLSFGYNVITYIFQIFMGREAGFLYATFRYILPTCVYNTVISPLLYFIIGKVYYRNERIF